jgi:hypothetical protein
MILLRCLSFPSTIVAFPRREALRREPLPNDIWGFDEVFYTHEELHGVGTVYDAMVV